MMARSGQSKTFNARHKRRMIIAGIAALASLASWTYTLSALSNIRSLQIMSVRVYGADPDIQPNLQGVAYRALEGSYLGLFSRANAFIYPQSDVVAVVRGFSPRIDRVTVKRDNLTALVITVTEKDPGAIVCAGLPDLDSAATDQAANGSACYISDATGFLFRLASASDKGYDRYYVPGVIDNDPVGQIAVPSEEFAALRSFVNALRAIGIKAESVLVKDAGEYELYVRSSTGQAEVIYFDSAAGLDKELSNLSAFWTRTKAAAHPSGSTPDFEYIDLRYGSNVFYRMIQ